MEKDSKQRCSTPEALRRTQEDVLKIMGQIMCNLLLQLSPQDFKEFGCFLLQSDIHFIVIQKILEFPESQHVPGGKARPIGP